MHDLFHNGRLWRLLAIELFKLRRRRMSLTLLGVLTLLCAVTPWLFYVAVSLGGAEEREQSLAGFTDRIAFPGALQGSLETMLSFGLPLTIVLVASSFGSEFAWGTLRLLLIRGEGRREYVLAKLVALSLWWIGAALIGVAVGVASAVATAAVTGEPGLTAISSADVLRFAGRLLGGLAGGVVYISFTAMLTLRRQSTTVGLAIGLFIFFGDRVVTAALEALHIGPLQVLIRSSINYNLRSLTGGAGEAANPLPLATIAIATYLLAMTVGAIRQLDRKDITITGLG